MKLNMTLVSFSLTIWMQFYSYPQSYMKFLPHLFNFSVPPLYPSVACAVKSDSELISSFHP